MGFGWWVLQGVETVDEQLAFFRKVKEAIIASIGVNAAEKHMQKSFFLISTGSNDFINLYNIDPIIQATYTPAQYEDLLISALSGYIQVSRPETSLILSVQTILEIFITASTFHKTNESIHTPTVYQQSQ